MTGTPVLYGDRLWESDAVGGPSVVAGDRVYDARPTRSVVGDADRFAYALVAVDLATGDRVAARNLGYQMHSQSVFAGGRVFVRTAEFDHSSTTPEHVADRIHALG